MSIEQVKAELDVATGPVKNVPTGMLKEGWGELSTDAAYNALGTIASWAETVILKAREIETSAGMAHGAGEMAQGDYERILTGTDHPAAAAIKRHTHSFTEAAQVQTLSAASTIEDIDAVVNALRVIDQKIGYIAGRITIGTEFADQAIASQSAVVEAVDDYKASL
jgi:hypothetical protein